MKKFTKIIESLESGIFTDIKNIFINLIDKGFELKIDQGQGLYSILLTRYGSKDDDMDYMECLGIIYVANKRLFDIGLDYFKADEMIIGKKTDNGSYSNILLRYNDTSSVPSKDVNSWKEFKLYVENVLGVSGIEGKLNDASYFRIDVASEEGWDDVEKYWGWQIDINRDIDDAVEVFVSEYPGYEDFLRGILKRRLDYDALWSRPRREENKDNPDIGNPLKFDKEGIEVVEKLLEMAKKFPSKIKVNKV